MSEFAEPRIAAIVDELRAAPPRTPERLRARVLAAAPAEPRVRLPRVRTRRVLLVGVSAAVAAVLVAAVVNGIVGSSGGRQSATPTIEERPVPPSIARAPKHAQNQKKQVFGAETTPSTVDSATQALTGGVAVPSPAGRLTDVQASLRLRVKNLDALGQATAQAQRIVRGLGGYVQSVDYTAPRGRPGNSYIELRVPVRRVQDALLRLSGLGTVLEQQVSTRDLQGVLDRQNAQIAALRRQIRRIEETLRTPLTPDQRLRLEFQLDDAKHQLQSRTRARTGTIREGSTAKISLQLTTVRAAVAGPAPRGRFDRALHGSLGFLASAAAVALAVLIAVSPLIVLGLMWIAAARIRRRRDEQRLLHATQ